MHQKHPKIARKKSGYYSTVEFALVGTNCERIEGLMRSLIDRLSVTARVVGITGDHGKPAHPFSAQFGSKQFFGPFAAWNEYDDHLFGSGFDLVLVNGNHYPAARQIIFIDGKKAGTLERRAEQLTDVAAVVLCPGETELPGWLRDRIKGEKVPVFSWENAEQEMVVILDAALSSSRAPVKGLVLAGGKSSRMGQDKSQLVYRQQLTEAERMARACESLGLDVFFSVAEEEQRYERPLIVDRFRGLGPMGAIASAFMHDPEAAWLVVACDLPLLEAGHIGQLLAARDPKRFGTAVQGQEAPFPEPLIAIYEPRAYARLLRFLSLGYACPRKLLINSDIATLKYENDLPLTNANTPAEREAARNQLTVNGGSV